LSTKKVAATGRGALFPHLAAALRAAVGLAVVLAATAQTNEPHGVPVLMYHKIDSVTPADAVGRSLTIAPGVFVTQLAWLRAHRIRTITMNELADALARREYPSNAVVLTFDDGYADAATVATPLLRKYGARATFYVSAGFVGDERHVSWRQLREMQAAGMEIGCHGTFHRDLTTLQIAAATYEIDHCAATIGHYVARPTTYAYAAGRRSRSIEQIVRQAHFKAALTERPGAVTSFANPYDLPRLRVARDEPLASFAALVSRRLRSSGSTCTVPSSRTGSGAITSRRHCGATTATVTPLPATRRSSSRDRK
jgi:peptidoglycan/xylan/chitin deacetylase (PgdA/CDA1 family)